MRYVFTACHPSGLKLTKHDGEQLGNSYRQGWGVDKDPVAAREFYETAANLGDSDAQNEVGWCYVEGFGCKKDKVRQAHLGSMPRRYPSFRRFAALGFLHPTKRILQ